MLSTAVNVDIHPLLKKKETSAPIAQTKKAQAEVKKQQAPTINDDPLRAIMDDPLSALISSMFG